MKFRLHTTFVLITALLFVAVPNAVADEPGNRPGFRHSGNALRQTLDHQKALEKLIEQYERAVGDVDKRFAKSAGLRCDRYLATMRRQVRSLNKARKFDTATAAQGIIDQVASLTIEAPKANGHHFLTESTLEVAGSEYATKLGVDLLVDIETAVKAHSDQSAAALKSYRQQVQAQHDSYREALKRVLGKEKQAGRGEAVKEIEAALEVLARPIKIDDPLAPPPEEDGEVQSERNNIFDVPDGDNEAQRDRPGWSGYYLLQYSINGRHGVEYVVKLDASRSKVLFVSRDSKGDDRVSLSTPIRLSKGDDGSTLVLQHPSDSIRETTVHRLTVNGDTITKGEFWWSVTGYQRSDEPAQRGRAIRLGNPDADLLGLTDGVYRAKMEMRTWKNNKPQQKTGYLEITVDGGTVMLSRHNWNKKSEKWSVDPTAFIFTVKTQGNELVMHYDQNEFKWPDVFVIDLSDKDKPMLKHWWRHYWRPRGYAASSIGELELVK